MASFWRVLLLFCYFVFWKLDLCNGSAVISNQANSPQEVDSTTTESKQITCSTFGCVHYFVLFYNQVLLEKIDHQVTITEILNHSRYVIYFLRDPTRVLLLHQAFHVCKILNHNTLDKCTKFFDYFNKKSYPIDEIPRICKDHFSVCKEPEMNLILTFLDEWVLKINNSHFDNCWNLISLYRKEVFYDNIVYARWFRTVILYYPDRINICSCELVHTIATLLRKINRDYTEITELNYPPEYIKIVELTCVVPKDQYSQPLWSVNEIKEIQKQFDIHYEEFEGQHNIEIAKLILPRYQYFVPALRKNDAQWSLKTLIKQFFSFKVNVPYYKTAVKLLSLVVQCMTIKDFEKFLKNWQQVFHHVFPALNTIALNRLQAPYYNDKLLDLTYNLFETIIDKDGNMFCDILQMHLSPNLDVISTFFLQNYNLKNNVINTRI